MKVFNHILVPTDFAPCSAEALGVATELARTFDAKLTLLHVWEIPIYPYMDFVLNSALIAGVEERAKQHLSERLDLVRSVVSNAASKLEHGLPWRGILDAIDELGPDLVVMGTHGHRGLNHVLLGSVAEKVVRLSPVPVLTVRARQNG